jgi:hypothetical protein
MKPNFKQKLLRKRKIIMLIEDGIFIWKQRKPILGFSVHQKITTLITSEIGVSNDSD